MAATKKKATTTKKRTTTAKKPVAKKTTRARTAQKNEEVNIPMRMQLLVATFSVMLLAGLGVVVVLLDKA